MSDMKISEVKGRPMLGWVGKKTVDVTENYPAQLVEIFQPSDSAKIEASSINLKYEAMDKDWRNLLFHGDNKEVLICLLQNGFRGKIDLIYIDPPFDSKADYIRTVRLRGGESDEKLEGEGHSVLEQKQYFDIWKNDDYLQFVYERLILMKELLSDAGSIYLHCDWHKSHHLRCLLDEVFGEENFRNDIIWTYKTGGIPETGKFAKKHDIIYFFSKTNNNIFNKLLQKSYAPTIPDTHTKSGKRLGVEEDEGGKYRMVEMRDTWEDLSALFRNNQEIVGYPTQKPEALLERIIKASSNTGSIVLDCFCGSGTTQAVAQKLGRRWIGCDINKGAIQTTAKRIQSILQDQKTGNAEAKPESSADSFLHFRVNDYDLQILRTEAIELARQKLGVRELSDRFFDGLLDSQLVKFIEIHRPLCPFDISDIQDELKKRPQEDRNITIVCLGQQENTKPIIAEHNSRSPVNKFTVIDLKNTNFMLYEPCKADIALEKGRLTIKNFVSPSIVKRLAQDQDLSTPRITDFRAMIDCLLIDNNYDGSVFNVVYSDIPAKKTDFIAGMYSIEQKGKVAVKIIDMLGEELLVEL